MGKRMNTFWVIMKYNLKIETRYPISYFAATLNALFWILAFATLIMMFPDNGNGATVGKLVAWGLFLYVVFNTIMSEVVFGIIRLQRRGTLEQILLAPISLPMLPLGLAGYQLVIAMFFGGVILTLFWLIFGIPITISNVPMALLSFAFFFMMIYGFALILTALTIRIKRTSWAFINALNLAYMIFCGAYYPFSGLPLIMKIITMSIPFSYAVDLFRTTAVGIPPELIGDLSIGGVVIPSRMAEMFLVGTISLVFLIIGYVYFIVTFNDARRRGYLGTY